MGTLGGRSHNLIGYWQPQPRNLTFDLILILNLASGLLPIRLLTQNPDFWPDLQSASHTRPFALSCTQAPNTYSLTRDTGAATYRHMLMHSYLLWRRQTMKIGHRSLATTSYIRLSHSDSSITHAVIFG